MEAIKSTKNYPLSFIATRKPAGTLSKKKILKRVVPDKIALPTMDGLQFEPLKNIAYLEAQGNYTFIHLINGKRLLICKTLRETEERIHSEAFIRVHRSHTVNIHLINRYVKGKGGYIIMDDGTTINVAASRKKTFLEAIHQFF